MAHWPSVDQATDDNPWALLTQRYEKEGEKAGQGKEALVAVDRALADAEGSPRQYRFTRARALHATGDTPAARTLAEDLLDEAEDANDTGLLRLIEQLLDLIDG